MSKNQFRKYFKYAFGEIVLVVIGILIALQINNWNENRKLNKEEVAVLAELREDLKTTSKELKNDLKTHITGLEANIQFIQFLKFNKIPDKDIGQVFALCNRDAQAYPKTSGYKLLESKGISIITNDTFRKEISKLYQLNIKRVTERGKLNPYHDIAKVLDSYEKVHFTQTNSPYYSVYNNDIKDSIQFYKFKTVSIEKLKRDNNLLIDLEKIVSIRMSKIYAHKDAISQIKTVSEIINKELEKL
ncbi:hypothetical protein BTO18_05365 [Polaribacter porphyrae]|uniref:Uncharacterized protein n=1 Tax=Polaribacter porphyrae TaxID=1137780 RepID=A0A2S7WN13_9FLAO|nr:hypothetical protein BTO18_05365 [Polaribacter porphyrae]